MIFCGNTNHDFFIYFSKKNLKNLFDISLEPSLEDIIDKLIESFLRKFVKVIPGGLLTEIQVGYKLKNSQ